MSVIWNGLWNLIKAEEPCLSTALTSLWTNAEDFYWKAEKKVSVFSDWNYSNAKS